MRQMCTIALGMLPAVLVVLSGCQTAPAPQAAATDLHDLDSPTYAVRRNAITRLAARAKTQSPTLAEAAAILQLVQHDPEWRIKVRALQVLPLLHEREQAVNALIAALNDRDPDSSGGGNVPLYACSVTKRMKPTEAVEALNDLLHFLQQDHTYSPAVRTLLIREATEALASISAKTSSV